MWPVENFRINFRVFIVFYGAEATSDALVYYIFMHKMFIIFRFKGEINVF